MQDIKWISSREAVADAKHKTKDLKGWIRANRMHIA